MAKQFDVVVIGGGPAGYVAAIRAGPLGLSVACAESNPYADPKGEPRLGGTCLNVGCIPSKALLQSSENYHLLHDGFAQHGISVSDAKIDIATMVGRKNKIVDQFTGGIKGLFRKYKVTFIPGHGRFVAAGGAGWKLDI
ncbi:MAG: FAD-dependent oxidoreductase, partial [bacterium]